MSDSACRIYESMLCEHGGDANAALKALAARYAAMASGVSRGFLRRPVQPQGNGQRDAGPSERDRSRGR
ncbi:MAG: hypothetical protein U1E62_26195 [Alsobacter sp.]